MLNELHVVVAFGVNGEWSTDDKIPFYSKEDMRHFRRITLNKNVMMGHGTYESLTKIDNDPLRDRNKLYVITSDVRKLSSKDKIFTFITYEEALEIIAKETIYLIGGYGLVCNLAPHVDYWHISNISEEYIVSTEHTVKHNWRTDLPLGDLVSVETNPEFTYLLYKGFKS